MRGPAERNAKITGANELNQEVDALLDYAVDWKPIIATIRGVSRLWSIIAGTCCKWCVNVVKPAYQSCSAILSSMCSIVPMKFEPSSKLTPQQLAEFNAAWSAAQANAQQPDAAQRYLDEALAIDPDHAGACFFMGRLRWEAGQFAQARQLLVRAKDNDVCPLRALSAMQAAVKQIAADQRVPLLDAESAVQRTK